MSKKEIDKSYFLTFCFEQFKRSRGITVAPCSKPSVTSMPHRSTNVWQMRAPNSGTWEPPRCMGRWDNNEILLNPSPT